MLEKLVENWLDNASERSYQSTFVQILNALSYRVLHSTRHCALEYGKDLIAIGPDGVPCAFQLKGKPGGRVGLNEFRSDMLPQLLQLVSQPVIFPGIDASVPHRSYLVCNGYFDEEVIRSVDDLNRGTLHSRIELISRGQLLGWAKELGSSVWPSELRDVRLLLEIVLCDGRDLFPIANFAVLLSQVLGLEDREDKLTRQQLDRAVTSAALLTGIAANAFYLVENHFAVCCAWNLFVVSVIGAHERSNLPLGRASGASVALAEAATKDALVALWEEVKVKPHLVEGEPLSDALIIRWRLVVILGLLSILAQWPSNLEEDVIRRAELCDWLWNDDRTYELWGESAIPYMHAFFSQLEASDQFERLRTRLQSALDDVVNANRSKSDSALSDPYYSFVDVARSIYDVTQTRESRSLVDETFAGFSFSARLMMEMSARLDFRSVCDSTWSGFSRMGHKYFEPAESWQYCTYRSKTGSLKMRQYPPNHEWAALRLESKASECAYLPLELAKRVSSLKLWTIVAPHRLTPEIARAIAIA